MDYFTIEQLHEIYAAAFVTPGSAGVTVPASVAHLRALQAVAEAMEDKFDDIKSACCESAEECYEKRNGAD